MLRGVVAAKYFFCVFLLCGFFAVQAAPQKPGFVQVELIAEQTAAAPGKPLWIGLSMKHDPGWHTYWKNPGDAGLPTTLAFTLPAGFQVGEIEWPHPERIPVKQLASYGYGDDLVLPLLLFVPKNAQGVATARSGKPDAERAAGPVQRRARGAPATCCWRERQCGAAG
jgi:DsbC/DsbD-like thiol-disulfide interchange protein